MVSAISSSFYAPLHQGPGTSMRFGQNYDMPEETSYNLDTFESNLPSASGIRDIPGETRQNSLTNAKFYALLTAGILAIGLARFIR